jgi:hypothetical protein
MADPLELLSPICFIAEGKEIWLVWAMRDRPDDAFLRDDGQLIWGRSRRCLVERLEEMAGCGNIGDDFCVDLDAVLSALRHSNPVRVDDVLNALNMLDDFAKCVPAQARHGFPLIKQKLVLYDKVFSGASVAEIVGVAKEAITKRDWIELEHWISSGSRMIVANTTDSLN